MRQIGHTGGVQIFPHGCKMITSGKYSNRLRRTLGLALALWMATLQVISGVAMAQIEDSESPVIIHRQADSAGVAGELQTFLARVYDDVEVVDVTLYYRQSAVANFQQIPMRPLLDSLGEYMIAIETSDSEYPGLQYYIEAVDAAGNVTNRGFSYAPIVLPLEKSAEPAAPAGTATAPVIAQAPEASSQGARGFSSQGLLIGLGALVLLGALAGSGGGGDSGGEPGPEPTPGNITLTIISDSP